MDSSIRASLERADQEIRQVLKKLDPSASGLTVTQELPTGPIHVDAQHMEEDPRIGDMFRDANTQTPEGAFYDEGQQETGVNEAIETHPDVSSSETQTEAAVQEQIIPIRLQMDSAEWYRRRATDQLWDVRSQVYIETTERTCVHLKDDKVTRPPYMQVTIEDVIVHCGETAQFDAVIDGSSPLTIAWYKDNNRLKESDRLQMVKEDRKYSLIFQGTKRGDGGVYTCTASNSAGEVSCKAELIMHEDEKEQDTKILHKRRKLKSFFEVKEEIGRGCFGFVKRVVHKGNGATCAAKFIPLRSKTRQQAYRERDILSEVSHSRITHLLDAFETKKTLILILELCCGEELLDRLYRKHTFTEKEVKLYVRQLLEAVAYLHNKNILHLDIKPSNILISKSDKEEIKLCDFGFAQKIITSEYQYSQYGSPEFVPPEIACQAPVSKSSDIWPVGVISYLCLVSVSPFAGQNDRETLLNVQQCKISWSCPGFTQLSANAKAFMKLTIQMSPDARPSATDCIQHKWFAESASPEDTKPISSKNLRFLVARSRWQRSLMCYKSILVMRSIPELLNSKLESTSLGVPRHLVECSSSSSSSGSSSDNESDVSPTSRDCNPSLELHLSIFKMSEKDRMEQPYTVEPEPETDAKEILVEEKMESKDITLPGIHDTSPMNRHKREHNRVTGLDESQGELEEAEKMLIHSVETSPRKQPLNRAATIEVGVLASKKPKTGSFVRGTSADSALLLQKGIDKPPLVCVPRQSIINSMFYNQACEGPAMASKDGPFKEKEFIKHRERARRSLMKAGYSQKILSGLREPLLEQFAMEQRMMAQDKSMADRDGQLSSLKKSASFDAAKGPLRSSFKASSRSRSLDDYKSRPLSVYKGTFVEEVDQDHSKGAKGVINTFDTDTKHHAEGLLIPDDSARATSAPPEVHQYSAPVKVSSTKRPLSAPPIGRDNTIIAVLHQQASLDTIGTKERSSSAMLEGDEGTIIAFVKPKQTAESDSLATQPSAVIYDADKVRCTTHPTELVSEEKGQSLDISGGVKFTVHTICDKNDFLTSDTSTEKASDEVKYNEDSDKNKKRTEEIFSESTTQRPVQFLQFSDDNTRISVIRQGTGEVLSLTRDITVLEEHQKCPVSVIQPCAPTLDFSIQITATTGPPGDRNLPDTITSELASNCYPIEKCTVAVVEDAEKVKPSIHHKLELGKDHHKEVFPSQILEHDIKVSLPTVHGDFSFQGDGRQSVSQDLQFSVYSDEQSATLEDLVGEMSSLSEEMDVLVSEQRQMGQGDIPFPPVIDQTKNPTGLQDAGNLTGDCLAMETDPSPLDQSAKEPQVTSISQCSFYESLSRAQVSPPYHEQFEEFTIESRSSSKTFISHSDSSGTGQRSDNFSDFEEGGRHSEVSLVEIGEIHQNRSSTSSELLTLDPFDFETTPSHLQNFYDIFTFPRQPLNIDKKSSSSNAQFNLSSVASQHATDFGETAMETSMGGALKDAKSSIQIQPSQPSDPCKIASNERKSSRKRIKLFRPHGKSETVGKSTEQSLKQKVKASVANISRMIKGKQGNGKEGPSEVAKVHIHEQAAVTRISGPVKKKGLPSFKLPNLTAKDKAPAFVEELTDQTVVVGHLVTLSCRTAQPVTDVEWYKDGVAIHSSERVLISSTLKNYHLLTILVVNARDFGIYACVATNVLGSASTCCIIKKAEIPCCPSSPDVAQVYKDGALLVWKPVESSTPVTYFLQYRKEGEEWRALTLDVSDCCYTTHNLSEGHVYSFRIACISKAGMGPYSNPSVGVRIGRRSPGLSVAGETQGSSERELTSDLHVMGKRGRFSTVRLCTDRSSGRALAAKIIPYTEERKEATLREYQILKKLHHTNLVQLHAAFLSPQHLVLVLELCEGRELLRCLSAGSSYSELEVRDYLWQMLSAVEFLHDKQILHLDLRSENTIVTEHKLVKILDFGDAQFYSPDKVITPQRYMDYFETMAPELVEGQGAAPPTDVWAVGITAFVMLSGDYPFSSDSGTELEKGMKKGLIRFSRCYAGLSGGAVCFLQSTLWANPWGRPSASDCLKTPWLQEAGLATLQEPPVFFPSEKLRGFLHERSKRERLAQSASSPPVQLSHPC